MTHLSTTFLSGIWSHVAKDNANLFRLRTFTFFARYIRVSGCAGQARAEGDVVPGGALGVDTALIDVIAGVLALIPVAKFVAAAVVVLGAVPGLAVI